MSSTRRSIQVILGVLWLVDGALQLQPFMFTRGFATHVIDPAGEGQPGWVAGPVSVFAHQIAAHPAPLNTLFAITQIALGLGFLLRPLVRVTVPASLAWSLGVWWFGEGLGGVAGGTGQLLTGAPGAVLLYAVLAVAARPVRVPHGSAGAARRSDVPVAGWLPAGWAVLWVGEAGLQLLPGQNTASELAGTIADGTDGTPGWLSATDRLAAHLIRSGGLSLVVALVVLMVLVGVTGLRPGYWRVASATAGSTLGLIAWFVGENIGELYSGQATDPNSGPLIILMAYALLGCRLTSPSQPAVFIPAARTRRPLIARMRDPAKAK